MNRSPLKTGAKSIERGSTFSAEPKPLNRRTEKAMAKLRNPRPISPASPAQRAKVRTQVCVVCQAEGCDPAHLCPRGFRGCDDAACVIALCRLHHEEFDRSALDLLPHLSGLGFGVELAHMQGHYDDPLTVLIRLSGCRWAPERSAA